MKLTFCSLATFFTVAAVCVLQEVQSFTLPSNPQETTRATHSNWKEKELKKGGLKNGRRRKAKGVYTYTPGRYNTTSNPKPGVCVYVCVFVCLCTQCMCSVCVLRVCLVCDYCVCVCVCVWS